MREINTLLELWEYWREICSRAPEAKSSPNNINIMEDVIRETANLAECLKFIRRISKPEEYSTQILCELLNKIEDFQFDFLQEIGLVCDRKNFQPYVAKAEHTIYEENKAGKKLIKYKYDISFWEQNNNNEKLIGIVEVKIDANFQNNQLKNYQLDLKNCNGKVLVLLTKYNMDAYKEVEDVSCSDKNSQIIFAKLFWHKVISLIKKYDEALAKQAFELFTSEYFLFHEKGTAEKSANFERENFINTVKEISKEKEIPCYEHKAFQKQCITCLSPQYGKKNWYGGLLALNIWLYGYSVTNKYEDNDDDLPKQFKGKAYPFFDIILKCYYQIDDNNISGKDLDKIEQLSAIGYEKYCIYDKHNPNKIKQKLLRKSLTKQINLSDTETLKIYLDDPNSEFWKILRQEISDWQGIVCGK